MISKKTPGDSNTQSKLGNNALKTHIPEGGAKMAEE